MVIRFAILASAAGMPTMRIQAKDEFGLAWSVKNLKRKTILVRAEEIEQ